MRRSRLIYSLLVWIGMLPGLARAQTNLPRAGESFSFGVIEGDYTSSDSTSQLQGTTLSLTVMSAYSGAGTITSPSGYTQDFQFAPNTPTILDLPLDFIVRDKPGKTNKGLLVQTCQPVNLVLHDYVHYAGEASQILPDNALDTNYVTFGWGIWNDSPSTEWDLLSEFLVTAVFDSTVVTITPSVSTVLGQSSGQPFRVILNRGECYVVQADSSDVPSNPSLSGSSIVSSKPVSVISGLTCAYAPIGVLWCNELMDELVGTKWWGSHFFLQPLNTNDNAEEIVLTSNHNFFANINNTIYPSSQGRVAVEWAGTAEIHTLDSENLPCPVEAHELSRGGAFCQGWIGDPSLVSILDTSYYADTIIWNSPSFDSGFSLNLAPIICPTADLDIATLDGIPLSLTGASPSIINGSPYSAINPQITSGRHVIASPDPVFALAAGFDFTDAYSFMPGTIGSKEPVPDLTFDIGSGSITTSPGDTILIPIYLSTNASFDSMVITIPFLMDTNVMQPIGFQSSLPGIAFESFSSSNGAVNLSLQAGNLILNGDTLIGFLRCVVYLSTTLRTTISLSNANLTSLNSSCFDLSATTDSVNILVSGCGDQTLLQFMQSGTVPLTIRSLTPNPATDNLSIALSNVSSVSYQLVDVLGEVRFEGSISTTAYTLDVSSLSSGIYFLRFFADGFVETRKVSIAR